MSSSRGSAAGRVVRRAAVGAWNDDIFTESASAAFWQTLSLPPLLLGLFGVLGYVGGWFGPNTVASVEQWIVMMTSGVFTREAVEQIIAPTVSQILTTARGEVVSFGFVLSLWSGSSAMSCFVDAITRAHDQYERRNLVWQRILAVLLYIVALCSGIVVLPIAAVGPNVLLSLLPTIVQPVTREMVNVLYLPVLAITLVVALTTLYKVALPFKPPWWRGLPGAVLAAVVFLVGATGLRLYLTWLTSTGYTYGALAAPIAFLLSTFFIAFSIIIGAHLNAALWHEWPTRLKRRGRIVHDPAQEESAPAESSATAPRVEPAVEGQGPPSGGGSAPGSDRADQAAELISSRPSRSSSSDSCAD
jgi:membrane protein